MRAPSAGKREARSSSRSRTVVPAASTSRSPSVSSRSVGGIRTTLMPAPAPAKPAPPLLGRLRRAYASRGRLPQDLVDPLLEPLVPVRLGGLRESRADDQHVVVARRNVLEPAPHDLAQLAFDAVAS